MDGSHSIEYVTQRRDKGQGGGGREGGVPLLGRGRSDIHLVAQADRWASQCKERWPLTKDSHERNEPHVHHLCS